MAMNGAFIGRHWRLATRFSAGRRVFDRHAAPVYCLGFLGTALIAAAVHSGRFDYDHAFVIGGVESCGSIMVFAWATRWIGFVRIADLVEQFLLLLVTGIVCAFCSVIMASTAAPLADDLLGRADLILFSIDRSRWLTDLHLSAQVLALWRFAYESFAFTPMLAMALLAVNGQRWRAWALLTALIACAAVSMTGLLFAPAFGTPPYPYAFAAVLKGARDGSIHLLDGSVITGIITFPSMHAADAVVLAVAFGGLGKWAAPLVALNIVMFFSAMIVGGHYAVDLVAGGVVGLACIVAATSLHRRIEGSQTPQITRGRRPANGSARVLHPA